MSANRLVDENIKIRSDDGLSSDKSGQKQKQSNVFQTVEQPEQTPPQLKQSKMRQCTVFWFNNSYIDVAVFVAIPLLIVQYLAQREVT